MDTLVRLWEKFQTHLHFLGKFPPLDHWYLKPGTSERTLSWRILSTLPWSTDAMGLGFRPGFLQRQWRENDNDNQHSINTMGCSMHVAPDVWGSGVVKITAFPYFFWIFVWRCLSGRNHKEFVGDVDFPLFVESRGSVNKNGSTTAIHFPGRRCHHYQKNGGSFWMMTNSLMKKKVEAMWNSKTQPTYVPKIMDGQGILPDLPPVRLG